MVGRRVGLVLLWLRIELVAVVEGVGAVERWRKLFDG
jgi:hypothetical protein